MFSGSGVETSSQQTDRQTRLSHKALVLFYKNPSPPQKKNLIARKDNFKNFLYMVSTIIYIILLSMVTGKV
jgi:hypothetical protein